MGHIGHDHSLFAIFFGKLSNVLKVNILHFCGPYGIDGEEKNGSLYFKDNLYFAQMDQVYAYNDGSSWKANLDYCFIKPIKNKSAYKAEKEQTNIIIYIIISDRCSSFFCCSYDTNTTSF